MANFSHLKTLEITPETTGRFTIHKITVNGKTPTLIGKPAGQSNKSYFNALLKAGTKNAQALRAGKITSAMIDENRDKDRELYPQHVITGWEDMLDGDGTELTFNKKDCAAFFQHLPDEVFQQVRDFYDNSDNFVEALDITVKAKN